MKAISLWQPWASLWASGRKKYETRHWPYRHNPGLIAIHAAKKLILPEDLDPLCAEIVEDEFGPHWPREMPRGAIVGIGRLIDCADAHRLKKLVSLEEQAMGDWSDGRYVWLLAEPKLLKYAQPWRGMQSFFDVPDEVTRQGEPLTTPHPTKARP